MSFYRLVLDDGSGSELFQGSDIPADQLKLLHIVLESFVSSQPNDFLSLTGDNLNI